MKKGAKTKRKPSKTVRVTISFPEKVDQWAEELMAEKGYDNFSAYIADLIRRDREQRSERGGDGETSENQQTPRDL